MTRIARAGIIGATGMVGQRFVTLLANHPWFELTALAASPRSAGKTYAQAVEGRWAMSEPIPAQFAAMIVQDAGDIAAIAKQVDFVFCAIDMDKAATRALEEAYAQADIPVVSNNSACRGLADVPMLVPELNHEHLAVIPTQRKRLGTKRGFIAVKPNCSIQSYVPPLHALRDLNLTRVLGTTYQAISGAGKTFDTWPDMLDNVIPFIGGEEQKSEQEPLKIWGTVGESGIVNVAAPTISTQCIRVPASDGHLAAMFFSAEKKITREEIIERWRTWRPLPQQLGLPSAPQPFIIYHEEDNRPQTRLDRDAGGGMAITVGRLRPDTLFDWKFVGLSHNTLRGAAGGAVLIAELLCAQGYFE